MGFILKIVSFIILALLHIIFLDIKVERMLIIFLGYLFMNNEIIFSKTTLFLDSSWSVVPKQ